MLESSEIAVLNSKVHRAIDSEYIQFGLPDPETQARLAELTEELDRRDEHAAAYSAPAPLVKDTASAL